MSTHNIRFHGELEKITHNYLQILPLNNSSDLYIRELCKVKTCPSGYVHPEKDSDQPVQSDQFVLSPEP